VKGEVSKNVIYANLYTFKKSGYLREFKKESKKVYKITNKGKVKILKYDIIKRSRKWDGKWRVIIFDIPANKKKVRDFLRNRLKILGFKQLQKKVFGFILTMFLKK